MWMDLEEYKLLHALAAVNVNHAGGCVTQDVAVGLREGIVPFSPALECWKYKAWFCPSAVQETNKLEPVQWRAVKGMKGLEDIPYQERLRAFGLFSLEKRRHLRGSSAICRSLAREDGRQDLR